LGRVDEAVTKLDCFALFAIQRGQLREEGACPRQAMGPGVSYVEVHELKRRVGGWVGG